MGTYLKTAAFTFTLLAPFACAYVDQERQDRAARHPAYEARTLAGCTLAVLEHRGHFDVSGVRGAVASGFGTHADAQAELAALCAGDF